MVGRFRSDSEGLRLLEDEERRRKLEKQLLQGLRRGTPIEVDDSYLDGLQRRIAKRAMQHRTQG